ncbi:MAG: hypothetical protein RIF33_11095 [Cyclobacteriaceae bacterium]
MKSQAGNSVLWFLVGCLALVETIIGVLGNQFKSSPYFGYWLLTFAFISLLVVLGALLIMFFKNPQFLIAEKDQLGLISYFQFLAANEDPELVKEVLRRFDPNRLVANEPLNIETSLDESNDEIGEEQQAISDFITKLKQEKG